MTIGEDESIQDYSKRKMAENREGWKHLGVDMTTIRAHKDDVDYLRSYALVATGKRMLQLVDDHDEAAIDVLCERRPRPMVNAAKLREIDGQVAATAHGGVTDKALNLIGFLNASFDQMTAARKESTRADKDGLPEQMRYWFAREYALAFCVKGSYALALMELNHYDSDLWG